MAGFFVGYLPRQRREVVLAAETKAESQTLPGGQRRAAWQRSAGKSNLVLPGNIQAVTEAPVLARATGYISKRYVDIGDRVKAGQVLAEIEAPELEQQIQQAKAAIDQAKSSVQQAEAALQQGRANDNLAQRDCGARYNLFGQGVVSKQDNDNYQAQYAAQQANVQALEKAVRPPAQQRRRRRGQSRPAEQMHRLSDRARALRRRDHPAQCGRRRAGNEGSTLLFRIAQTGPPAHLHQRAAEPKRIPCKPGQTAMLSIRRNRRAASSGHGDPHGQRARPGHAHAADGSPGAESAAAS